MKKILFIAVAMLSAVSLWAQQGQRNKFSPKEFQAELERFIVKEACLTPTEAANFFPIYNEMYRKQRVVFDNMRRLSKSNPTTEADCRKVIKERDKLDIELKKIQQTYHNKFLDILSAKKVFDVIRAEDRFHRSMLKRGDGRKRK